MLKRISFGFLILLILTGRASAQSELTLPFLNDAFQSSYVNPAAVPGFKVSVGLPGISSIRAGVTNTGFTLKRGMERKNDTTLYWNMTKVLDAMPRNNFVYAGVSADLLHVRVKVDNLFVGLNITEHAKFRFSYPRDLINFPWKGNAEYLDEEVNLKKLGVDALHYREYGIGIIKQDEKSPLTIGVRAKLLQGFSNVSVRNKSLHLKTDGDMYALSVDSDVLVNTNLPVGLDDSTNQDFDVKKYATTFSNIGLGLDIGASYKYGSKLSFHAALIDLGFIRWKSNAKNYGMDGDASFDGFDPVGELYKEDFDMDNYVDSLANRFETTETENAYTTRMISQLYLGAQYKLAERTFAGANLFLEHYKTFRPALTFAVTHKLGTVLDLVLSYSAQYRQANNVGMAIMFKPGPVQIYIAGDNLFRQWTTVDTNDASFTAPLNAKFLNFRFGINLVFGRIKQPDKQPLPTE